MVFVCVFLSLSLSLALGVCICVQPNALQHTATHCNTLQHTATQYMCTAERRQGGTGNLKIIFELLYGTKHTTFLDRKVRLVITCTNNKVMRLQMNFGT